MLKEFREFLEKFNVIPVAVGLVLALAFGPVVNAVVSVIMTLIGLALGAEGAVDPETGEAAPFSFDSWQPGGVPLGTLITAIFSFILIAFVVFMIVRALARAGARTELAETPDQALLAEIRDLLRSQQG